MLGRKRNRIGLLLRGGDAGPEKEKDWAAAARRRATSEEESKEKTRKKER